MAFQQMSSYPPDPFPTVYCIGRNGWREKNTFLLSEYQEYRGHIPQTEEGLSGPD